MVKFRDTEQVFLYTLQEDGNREEIHKRIQQFNDNDWQILYELVTKNGLFPIFYTKFSSLKLENLPTEFLSKLKNLYFLNLKRNILLEQELFKILAYFQELNTPVIPIKGPILARYLYNDLALRQTPGDLDLLVRYEGLDGVREELTKLNYFFCGIEPKRDFLFPIGLSKQVEQIMFSKCIDETLNINLDLHWCIRGFYIINDIQRLWQEARPFDLDGQKILMLSNEDTLIYLTIISISILEFVQLKYIYDIHRLVTAFKEELDWDKLLCKAKNLNLENCLYFPLKLSTILFLTDVPKAFLSNIEPDWIPRRLIGLYINEKSTLEIKQKVHSAFFLRYLLGRYLYSGSLNEFLGKSFRRISSIKAPSKLSNGVYLS